MHALKVSILIPLYNSANYIGETIQSALSQTWPNIEVIIVDDGSIDNGYTIAKKFEGANVKVYQQKNSGACAARNLAFEKSSGNFIQYLDADDLLAPDKIEKQMHLFEQAGHDIICSCLWGRFYDCPKGINWEEQKVNKNYLSPIEWLIDSWMGKGMAQTAVWLAPRTLIEKAGPWNESLSINQDGEFFSRVLMQAKSIHYCNTAKVYYRSGNPTSISQSRSNRAKAQSLLKSYQLDKSNVSHHLGNRLVRKALANNFLNYIYQNHSQFSALARKAEEEFKALEVGKMWPVGGKRFKQVAKIFGLINTLKIQRLFK